MSNLATTKTSPWSLGGAIIPPLLWGPSIAARLTLNKIHINVSTYPDIVIKTLLPGVMEDFLTIPIGILISHLLYHKHGVSYFSKKSLFYLCESIYKI